MSTNVLKYAEPKEVREAKEALASALNSYLMDEYKDEPESTEFIFNNVVGLAYTELGEANEHSCNVYLNASKLEIVYFLDNDLIVTEKYKSLQELTELLKSADFEGFISLFYDYIEE